MSALLRPVQASDHAWLLDLNERHVEVLSPLDQARLEALLGWAHEAWVITDSGRRAGFVLTFRPGSAYDSENYRWFSAALDDFVYLDRIVLDDGFQRRGLGAQTYDELEARLAGVPLVLEVNVDPPNAASLAFHAARGYREVSRLGPPGKQVALMRGPGGAA